MTHAFLSDEWMAAAKAVREKYAGQSTKVTTIIKMNQVITDVPFGDGTLNVFLDTSSGDVVMDLGALEAPDLTVTTDYVTARQVFVDQNQAAGMQAFMSGKIKVQGRHDENDGAPNRNAAGRDCQADFGGDQRPHRLAVELTTACSARRRRCYAGIADQRQPLRPRRWRS